jgi:NADH-quinone oxidoreductase subunit J
MNPTLLSPEGLSGVIFLVVVAVTILGAVIATSSRRLVRSVSGLAVCFMGVAGLYFFLNSMFVAMMQLLIYVGAVCIVIAFGIMLAEPDERKQLSERGGLNGILSLVIGGICAWGLAAAGTNAHWMTPATKINSGSMKDIGMSLLTTYSMVFELVSIVLLVAIIGALAIARTGRDKS